MNKWGVAVAGVCVLAVGAALAIWSAPATERTGDPLPVATLQTGPAPLDAPAPVFDDPVPMPDLGAQTAELRGLLDAPGVAGEVHREVASHIDQTGLTMRDRLWVHDKVDRWLSARAEATEQVARGEMSAADAASNGDEELEALADSLGRRTPEVRDPLLETLRRVAD